MRQLDKLPNRRPESKYDYDRLFDGNPYELIRGEDFDVTAKRVRETMMKAAHVRKIAIKCFSKGDSVFIQRITGDNYAEGS